MNDIEKIYNKLKNSFDIRLTNTFELDEGFTIDVPVICGESQLGKFLLYPCEGLFVFSVEYKKITKIRKKVVKSVTHWHPQSIEASIEDITKFMTGERCF